jgi:protein-tyrosine phosphatase
MTTTDSVSGSARERRVALAGAYNLRDLGGYPTRDGGVTRWGRFFRSDALHELTDSDVATFMGLGVVQIVDLRSPAELERSGWGPLGDEPLRMSNLPVTQQESGESRAAPTAYHDRLADRYLWYLEVGGQSIARTLTMAGDDNNVPMLFHCSAGKDRTGVVAAMILDIVGVERETIVDDYTLTASAMPLILDRLRRDPAVGSRIDEVPPHMFEVQPGAMEGFLDLLYQHHGGARQWALEAGVPADALLTMTELLLERGA